MTQTTERDYKKKACKDYRNETKESILTSSPIPMDETNRRRSVQALLREGVVIPAHPLALTAERKFDERRQRALTRYYCAAGVGGVAVAVHTTQFEIRDPAIGLLKPVLELAAEVLGRHEVDTGRPLVRVAGACGPTPQAVAEATLARELGYDAALLNLGALAKAGNEEMIEHCARVAEALPLFGFYLQPAIGGRVLDYGFWRRFLEIGEVVAIKVAPFDRYKTLDVARALADSGRSGDVALYTGNDDAIVADLMADADFGGGKCVRILGGLLGSMGDLDGASRRDARGDQGLPPRARRAGARDPDAGPAAHGCQRGAVRRAQQLRRLHRGHQRIAAPPGPARRQLVPQPQPGALARTSSGDRPGMGDLSPAP